MKKSATNPVFAYRCTAAIEKLAERFSLDICQSEEIFEEMLKWLFFVANRPAGVPANIYSGMTIIDEAWHEFILCTSEYEQYCKTHYGGVIHHYPTIGEEKRASHELLEKSPYDFEMRVREQVQGLISGVADVLGIETARRWFEEYPKSYSPVALLKGQIAAAKTRLFRLSGNEPRLNLVR